MRGKGGYLFGIVRFFKMSSFHRHTFLSWTLSQGIFLWQVLTFRAALTLMLANLTILFLTIQPQKNTKGTEWHIFTKLPQQHNNKGKTLNHRAGNSIEWLSNYVTSITTTIFHQVWCQVPIEPDTSERQDEGFPHLNKLLFPHQM